MIKFLHKLYVLTAFLLGAFANASASVVINEAMPCNTGSYMDMETYDYSAYVELYNNGTDAVNLNGFSLVYKATGDEAVKNYTINYDCIVAAGGYSLFYFDKAELNNHVNYKLAADGGSLVLTDVSGTAVSSLVMPDMCAYFSYGVGGYMEPTPGAANTDAYAATSLSDLKANFQCAAPVFDVPAGVYAGQSSVSVTMSTTTPSAVIYYTTDGSIPTMDNGSVYTAPVEVSATSIFRARAYLSGKLCSPIATASYILNDAKHTACDGLGLLPVVSVVTEPGNFYDDVYGIAVEGTNGIDGGCSSHGNYNQDWTRPVNFEYIVDGKSAVNQELEVKVMGGCSSSYDTKSLSLSANKKCGSGLNKIKYPFFDDKPDMKKFKSLHLRNGGNNYSGLRFRDCFMQSLVHGENIDYQAGRPVGYYINGAYQGLMLLNEHTSEDYVYSNYGLDADDIDFIKMNDAPLVKSGSIDAYNNMIAESQIGQSDSGYYDKMNRLMDMDEYMTYMAFEQFIVNTDWICNNVKLWRNRNNGRFRWIVYDTDFGFGLYGLFAPNYTTYTTNMILFCMGEGSVVNWSNGTATVSHYKFDEESKWKTVLFASLMQNDEFKNKFLTKNLLLLNSRFLPAVVTAKFDSIAEVAYPEYCAMRTKGTTTPDYASNSEVKTIKKFAEQRPANVLNHLASYYGGEQVDLKFTSNVAGVTFNMNGLYWGHDTYDGQYISNNPLSLTAIAPDGYAFKYWLVNGAEVDAVTYSTTVTGDLTIEAVFEATTVEPQIFVNEVCASNVSAGGHSDECGNYGDWIELYNDGDEDVNVAGWFVSDDKADLEKYQIPYTDMEATTIPAKGHKLVWCDNDIWNGPMHIDFKLSATATNSVVLSRNANGSALEIDAVDVPANLGSNSTYGRSADASADWLVFTNCLDSTQMLLPTPAVANGSLTCTQYQGVDAVANVVDGVVLFPNPVRNVLNVYSENDNLRSITLFNTAGQRVLVTPASAQNATVSVADLPMGVYMVEVLTETGSARYKLVKE